MSISSETSKTIFPCNGSTTTFDFDFKVFTEADLEVILYTIADGTETTLTIDTDYSVSSLTELGGRITTVSIYSSAYKLIAKRKQGLVQELDYTQNDAFSTLNLEQQLDKMVMMIQDLQEQVDRAVKFDSSIINAETVINLPNVTATVTSIDINGLTEKTAPVDDDIFIIEDSEADYQQKKVKKTKVLVINTLKEKTTPAANDLILIEDSAASNVRKKLKKSNLVPLDTDGTLAANSDSKIATQKATKTYADTKISKTTAGEISAMTEKTALVDDDSFIIEDSEAGNAKKKVKKSNVNSIKSQLFTSDGNWTCPAGVTKIYIMAVGGGGGGGGGKDPNAGSGGGAGGMVIKYPVTVTPTSVYAIDIGAGGAGGDKATPSAGSNGSNTTFNTTSVVAPGGTGGGAGGSGGGAGGIGGFNASGATAGKYTFAGGNGGDSSGPAGGAGGGTIFGAGAVINQSAVVNTGAGGGGGGQGSNGGNGGSGFLLVECLI